MADAAFTLDKKDYVTFNQRICARRFLPWFGLGLLVIVASDLLSYGSVVLSTFVALAVMTCLSALWLLILVPRSTGKMFDDQRSMREPRELTLEPDGIFFTQPSGTFRLPWVDIFKWDESDALLVVYVNRAMLVPITKADVGSEVIDRLKALLNATGLQKGKRRKI